MNEMDLQKRIQKASDELSKRIDKRIEKAFIDIRTAQFVTMLDEVERQWNSISSDTVTYCKGSLLESFVNQPDAMSLHQYQFTKSALWLWGLLWGHWEYYKAFTSESKTNGKLQ